MKETKGITGGTMTLFGDVEVEVVAGDDFAQVKFHDPTENTVTKNLDAEELRIFAGTLVNTAEFIEAEAKPRAYRYGR